MAGWSEPSQRRPDKRNPSPPNLPHAFMEQTLGAILRRNRRRRSSNRRPDAAGKRWIRSGGEGEGIGRVKCARTHGASASPRRFAEIAHNNAKANPTAEAIKKRTRRCGGGESAHAPIPIEPNTQQKQPTTPSAIQERVRDRENLSKKPNQKLERDQQRIRQAGLIPSPEATNQLTTNPASQRHKTLEQSGLAQGGVKIGFLTGRGEGGPEILADFSSSDFCTPPPARSPARNHTHRLHPPFLMMRSNARRR